MAQKAKSKNEKPEDKMEQQVGDSLIRFLKNPNGTSDHCGFLEAIYRLCETYSSKVVEREPVEAICQVIEFLQLDQPISHRKSDFRMGIHSACTKVLQDIKNEVNTDQLSELAKSSGKSK